MYVALFSRYEELCFSLHSSETALKILADLTNDYSSWGVDMLAKVDEDSFKISKSWGFMTLKYVEKELEEAILKSEDSNERDASLKMFKYYKEIENKYEDYDLDKFKVIDNM